jgi:ATP synthase protein I
VKDFTKALFNKIKALEDEEKEREKLESRIESFRASQKQNQGISPWEGLSLLGSLGFVVAGSIMVGLGVGVYLDRRLSTEPWLTVAGLVLGLLAAGFGSYELIRNFLQGKQ